MKRKRLKAVIMSAVILSTIVASGCSADNAASKSEHEAASGGLTVSSDSTASKDKSKSDSSAASSDSNTESAESTKSAEEPAPSENSDTSETEWKETAEDSVKYVSVDCYSRKTAILGAETVKLYSANEKVEVVAITDTGYCKLKDGTFIHSDYLSDSKVTVTTEATAAQPTVSEPTESVAPATTASTKAPADVPSAPTTKATTTSKPKGTTATTKAPAPVPSTPSAAVSGYTWVIEPSYDYDDVNILCSMSKKPVADIRLWDDNTDDHDSGEKLPVGFVVSRDNNYGLISLNGDLLMDCEYRYISMFSGFAEAMKADSGYSYTLGSDYEVHIMENFGHGGDATYYIYDERNSKIGYIDPNGIIICDEYDMEKIANRAILLKSGTLDENNGCREDSVAKFGLMYKNRIIVRLIFDGGSDGNLVEYNPDIMEMCDVKDGRAVFWKNNKIYVFDKDGNCYSDGVYDKVDNGYQELNYFNGYLPVCKDGKWGLIDVNGNEVLTCQFEDITSVYDGKAWAKQNGKWGVIELA